MNKNLRYHGLIQAYSRTNRIYDATKTFGNIVTFRNLEQATIDAITLFGDTSTRNVVLEKSYKEYMEGFTDILTGEARRGFVDVVKELEERFPDPSQIVKESDKKAFTKLFGEYLRVENVLQNYDEFASLKALQCIDTSDPEAVETFKAQHYLNDDDLAALQDIRIPAERKIQDYRSTYNDIRDWLRREKASSEKSESSIDWDDVVFEVDLLKSQEINLDYILELFFENNKKVRNKSALVEDVRRVIRASLGNRAKESLLVDFINQTDLDPLGDKASVIEAFFTFAQAEQQREACKLIESEGLNEEAARRYLSISLKREFASEKRHRAQRHPAQDEPAESAISDQKTKRFPENRRVCGEVQRCGREGLTNSPFTTRLHQELKCPGHRRGLAWANLLLSVKNCHLTPPRRPVGDSAF